jgi:hypothetical protein
MKTKLIITFIVSQIVEFGVFWILSNGRLSVFLGLVGVDLILTSVFCSRQVNEFISILTNEQNS